MGAVIIAGILSVLSPCVLPMIPIVLTTALNYSRRTLAWMLAGYFFSFLLMAIFFTIIMEKFSVDPNVPRKVGGILLIAMSLAIILPVLSSKLQNVGVGMDNFLRKITPKFIADTAFFKGATLGLLWVPCVGPSLGIALGLVTVQETFLKGAGSIVLFGISSSLTLFAIAVLINKLGFEWFHKQTKKLRYLSAFSATIALIVGIFVLFHIDRHIESVAVDHLPEWWLDLLTKY